MSGAALLGNELAEARQWVGEVLGDLAVDNDNNARLRETLRVFPLNRAGYKAAAAELDLHFNTVKYRIERAVSQRGRDISEDGLDVELALLICYWYGSTILQPDTT
ncbi:helix-turn-helix domain-containing protein [Nocardia brevicatena]|uniref:PucR family transcriptional regulator n=1 Tax=Nocardia brevicatena TaxID=37327 RepID=UPI001FE1C1DE|nr:helix-turn-helix domain-containing protein [Nocardia brevicatena]